MKKQDFIKCQIITMVLAVLVGCQAGTLREPKVNFEIPLEFASADKAGSLSIQGWLKHFNDQRLEKLVNEALAHNVDLKRAGANLKVAEENAVKAGALLEPTLGLSSYYTRERSLKNSDNRRIKKGVSLDISWELDVWGRIKAEKEAMRAEFEASASDYEFAIQSLAAQVAKSWFYAIESKLQMRLAESVVENYEKQHELIQLRYDMGDVDLQDVHLIRADLANARQEYLHAKTAHEETLRNLELLIGRYPAAEITIADALPEIDTAIPPGLPSDLLERRPDLIAAQKRVWAAYKMKEAAQKARLPKFSLTSSVGTVSSKLNNVVDLKDTIFNLSANLLAPIYEGGRLKANVDIADANQKAALADFNKAAINAFSEVETALSNADYLKKRTRHFSKIIEENQSALDLIRLKYESGESDLISVLLLQLRVDAAQTNYLRVKSARLTQQINLFLSLGGGFKSTEGANK